MPEGLTNRPSTWTEQALAPWRERIGTAQDRQAEPVIAGATPQEFFATLRAQLPDAALVVTDSGLHQVMARRFYEVRQPAWKLLCPPTCSRWALACPRPSPRGLPPRPAPSWRSSGMAACS